MKLSKGICGIVKGYLWIYRRASAQSELSRAFMEACKMIPSYCFPRMVEGSACSSRKGGIVVAVLYIAVDHHRQRAGSVHSVFYS